MKVVGQGQVPSKLQQSASACGLRLPTWAALPLAVAAAVLLAGTAVPAQAQNRMSARAVAVTSLGPVGSVEAVHFSGNAQVSSRLAPDAQFGKPSVVLLFDLAGVVGVGAQTRTRYVLSAQEHIVRPHAARQDIEFTFPMATDDNAPIARVRTGSARFVMNIDLATGSITALNAVLTAR